MITVPLCDSFENKSEPSGALDAVADMFIVHDICE